MNKEEIKKILDKLNIEYTDKKYMLGQSGLQLKNAKSYLELQRCNNVCLNYVGIYLYFDKDNNFILIEGTE